MKAKAKQKRDGGMKFQVCLVWDEGYDRRTFPTVKGAVEFWADGVVRDLMWNKNYGVGKTYTTKRLELRRKAIRRAKPIFERVMNNGCTS